MNTEVVVSPAPQYLITIQLTSREAVGLAVIFLLVYLLSRLIHYSFGKSDK